MKTAVLISGHLRTMRECFKNQQWFLYRRLQDPHFFISCVDDENAQSVQLLQDAYPGKVFVEKLKQPELPDVSFEYCEHAPYPVTPTKEPGVNPTQGFLRLFWHLGRVWEFFGQVAKREEFDVVMQEYLQAINKAYRP